MPILLLCLNFLGYFQNARSRGIITTLWTKIIQRFNILILCLLLSILNCLLQTFCRTQSSPLSVISISIQKSLPLHYWMRFNIPLVETTTSGNTTNLFIWMSWQAPERWWKSKDGLKPQLSSGGWLSVLLESMQDSYKQSIRLDPYSRWWGSRG